MQFSLQLDVPALSDPIQYTDNILLIGSCFTEHMSDRLTQHKFHICNNPNGILFNPLSVAQSLNSYVSGAVCDEINLFYLNELWNSWEHHTRFSDINKKVTLDNINSSLQNASTFIKSAKWIIITLGSAFQYYLKENNQPVSNNHRAPSQWFEKRLLGTDHIQKELQQSIDNILTQNSNANFIFTVSPVRHVRDGVVANNRSKARLLEAVHRLCEDNNQVYYFPAYELVIDILRDYRFYDIDFVHPNYLATQFVWEQFVKSCVGKDTQSVMQLVAEITLAKKHKPRFPDTNAHKKFLTENLKKTTSLLSNYPFLDLSAEQQYFNSESQKRE